MENSSSGKQKSDLLLQSLKISPVICNILVQRGIETFEQSKKYFRPELTDLHDPWLMKDMD
jgi:single-stranded-DNA-specific exonuclease